jgi:hypothetical protein
VTEEPAPDAPPESSPHSQPGIALVTLGACAALAVTMLPDTVLMPEIDRTPPRALGLSVVAALLSIGWWLGTWRTREVDGGRVLLAGGCLLVGGGTSLMLMESMHESLMTLVASGSSRLPYTALVALHVAAAGATYLLPLGALLGMAFGAGGRKDVVLALLGAGTALALAPVLGEEWLGRRDTLSVVLVLSAATAVSLLRRTPWTCEPARFAPGHAAFLVTLGAIAALGDQLARPHIDLGTNDTPWFAASICLAAALGACMPRAFTLSPIDGCIPLAAAWLFTVAPGARLFPTIDPATSMSRLAIISLPLGFTAGMLLTRRGRGLPVSLTPALLLLAVPFIGWLGVPRLGVGLTCACLAGVLALCAVMGRPRPRPLRALSSLAVTAVVLSLQLPGPIDGTPVVLPRQLSAGHAGWLRDPTDGRSRVAVDGVAPLSRHPLQEHRLVHVPFLLQGAPDRVLLVATDTGEAETAVLGHNPAQLDWLRPFPVPGVHALDPEPPGRRRPLGGERMFFKSYSQDIVAGEREPYEIILLMPDPRVRRRAGLLATREFYATAERLLTADGLFCQWWDPAFIHPDDLLSALASANSVFASATLIIDHPRSRRPLVGIVGTRRQLQIRPRDIRAQMRKLPGLKREFDRVGLDPLLVSCLVGPSPGVVSLLAPAHMALTDARPRLGARGGRRRLDTPKNLFAVRDLVADNRSDPMQWTRVPDQLSGVAIAQTRALHEAWTALFKASRSILQRHGENSLPFENETPGTFSEREAIFLLEAFRAAPDWPYLEQLVIDRFLHLDQAGHHEQAEDWLREALERDFRSTRLRMVLAEVMERDGDLAEAAVLYQAILSLTPDHLGARVALERLGSG